uniref:Retrotransposon gag domain-containing protein n=1 Tax=Ananas comosus var. bracteatus TaxID=296719 RepID=A0A6V7P9S9_ANACO|nr:unnamed protein product [Ananas comosus var. bracteatus]
MVEGTRLRDLSEHIITLKDKMQKLTSDYQGKVKELVAQINDVKETEQKHFMAVQKEATQRHELVLQGPVQEVEYEAEGRAPKGNYKNSGYHQPPIPKLEFPYFYGKEPKAWVENCEQYFEVFQIPPQQWLGIATMYLGGKARTWKHSYFISRQLVTWDEFTEAICRRFSQVGERYLVREFTNLKQYGTIEKCQEKFEELRTQLLSYNLSLIEEYLIACYINGLREDLVPFMDIAHPDALEEAYEQAKLHERALTVMNKKAKGSCKMVTQYQSSPNSKPAVGGPVGKHPQKGVISQNVNNKQLMEQRRAAGLCFKCGDKYHHGHICANRNFNCLHGTEEITEVYDEASLREGFRGRRHPRGS